MNLILIEPAEIAERGGRACVNGRRLRHVREVHRARPGDRLRVGIVNGAIGTGTVVRMDDEGLELEIIPEATAPPPLPVSVLLALPRPKVLKRVLQGLAALGVKRIHLMNTWRVEKSYWQSPFLRADVMREQLILGLEQAGDTQLPTIALHSRFKPFVEDDVPAIVIGTSALVAHPDATSRCPRGVPGPLTVAIGPEGGFIPYEIELLQAQGFEPVSLGPRRLRVEQAVTALLARML